MLFTRLNKQSTIRSITCLPLSPHKYHLPSRRQRSMTSSMSPPQATLSTLENLNFDNTFTKELPADTNTANTLRQVHDAFFSYVQPTPTGTEPNTIITSTDVAELIGLDPHELDRPEFALVFSGQTPLPGSKPYAQCYGGHQFGSWASQLGDGRAICLGEVLNPTTGLRWELQLKGAGTTPYSRRADGRAVLRSSLREYVASEAMHALGVPTTRALSLIATGDEVLRDMFYNGDARLEPGAIVCRVARSFIRFGTFQLPVSRDETQIKLIVPLADYVIKHFYPECDVSKKSADVTSSGVGSTPAADTLKGMGSNKYANLLIGVARRTGFLVSEWSRVGFTHGVLNTDNMSILGDTIDYGPYAWLERFDPNFTSNTTDLPGRRYAFNAQPEIGQWNILQLARAMLLGNLMTEEEAREALVAYVETLTECYNDAIRRKLGLKSYDRELAAGLLKEMYEDSTDYTNTFRALRYISIKTPDSGDKGEISKEFARAIEAEGMNEERQAAWKAWIEKYRAALQGQGWKSEEERLMVQDRANPAIVPRNHVMVGIINEAEEGNYEPLHKYMKALAQPYEEIGLEDGWLEPAPKKCRLGVELLSCSS